MWPPQSPDLSPLDFGIWGNVERVACATPHPSVPALKTAVDQAWADMSDELVVRVCARFRPRLEDMVAAEGGHFEK